MSTKKTTRHTADVSRREFARRATVVAAAVIVPASDAAVPSGARLAGESDLAAADDLVVARLSPWGRARFDAMWRGVLQKHGDRLTAEQKVRLRKIVAYNVRMLEAVYAVPVQNGDAPASVLKLVDDSSR